MTSRPIVIIGASGLGRECADLVLSINGEAASERWDLHGVFDDQPTKMNMDRLAQRGLPYLGPIPTNAPEKETYFVVGIGNPKIREMIASRLEAHGWIPATLIHPSVSIGSQSRIGAGTVMRPGVKIGTNVEIGRHVHLNTSGTIGHDVVMRDFVSVNPAATVSGEVTIGARSLVGAGAVILQGLMVGDDVTVAASACVTKNVVTGALVKGIPAR
jgi:sugar O-acyltransferase (sialic acid O-acetyltransferase NeuD family)